MYLCFKAAFPGTARQLCEEKSLSSLPASCTQTGITLPGSSAALRTQIGSGIERFSIDCKSTGYRWILQARHCLAGTPEGGGPDHSGAGKLQGHRALSVLKTEIHRERFSFLTLTSKENQPCSTWWRTAGKNHHDLISPLPDRRWVQDCTHRQEEHIPSNHFGSGNVPPHLIFDIKHENTLICVFRDNSKVMKWILSASSLKFR